jgi:hypothetical protein
MHLAPIHLMLDNHNQAAMDYCLNEPMVAHFKCLLLARVLRQHRCRDPRFLRCLQERLQEVCRNWLQLLEDVMLTSGGAPSILYVFGNRLYTMHLLTSVHVQNSLCHPCRRRA